MDKKTTINRCNVLIRIHRTWRGDDLLKLDDVRVVQILEDFNLADRRDGELRRMRDR
jgi:hypothetical protein